MLPCKRLVLLAALLTLALFPGLTPGQEALKEFTSAQGKFSIMLPGTPKLVKQTVNGINNYVYAIENVDGITYAISYFDLPANLVLTLETSVQAYAKGRKGTLLSDKRVMLKDSTPAREGLVRLPDQTKVSRLRVFIIGQRYFQLILDGTQESVTSKTANEVLDSFKRTN